MPFHRQFSPFSSPFSSSHGLVEPQLSSAANASQITRACLFCARERAGAEYASASLWPRALGGLAAPPVFNNHNMCSGCLDLCLAQVDAPFLASWFMQAEMGRAAQAFLDPAHPGPAPLAYLGLVADFPTHENEQCERWSGMAGELIFHICERHDNNFAGHASGGANPPPGLAAGRVILVLASPSRFWSSIALASAAAHFVGKALFCVNPFPALNDLTASVPSPVKTDDLAFLRQPGAGNKLVNHNLRADCSGRFLAKLALGLGNNWLGPSFSNTADARQLRRCFWQAQPQTRSFPDAPLNFALAGVWSLCVVEAGGALGLVVVMPTGKSISITICTDASAWQGPEFAALRKGLVYVAIPQRGIFTQAMPLAECVAHVKNGQLLPALQALQAMQVSPRQLPSKQGFA